MDEGDFVLRSVGQKGKETKLILRWGGLYRVRNVLYEFLFEVRDRRTSEHPVTHEAKLRFFRNKDTEECKA